MSLPVSLARAAISRVATAIGTVFKAHAEELGLTAKTDILDLLYEATADIESMISLEAPDESQSNSGNGSVTAAAEVDVSDIELDLHLHTAHQDQNFVSESTSTTISEASIGPPAEIRRRSERLIAVSKATADEPATVRVTPSATGLGAHCRRCYPDGTLERETVPDVVEELPSLPPVSDFPSPKHEPSDPTDAPSPFLSPAAATDDIEGSKVTATPSKQKPPKRRVAIATPPPKCAPQGVARYIGPSRNTRGRLSAGAATNSFLRNGVRYHFTRSSPASAMLPPVSLFTPPTDINTPPFNHFPKLPRSRPQALRREPAFYHRSHYEVAWTPDFGVYDNPPKTVEEAMPPRTNHGATQAAPMPPVAPQQAPAPGTTTPPPTSPSSSSKKRAREETGGLEDYGKDQKRVRTSRSNAE